MATKQKGVSEELQYIPLDDPTVVLTTFDLGAAAALAHIGFELISLDRENPKKIKFIFQRDRLIDEAIKEYWAGTLSVGARSYFDSIKMLKNRIYSE